MKNKYSWINPELEVKEVGGYGKGIFAKSNIAQDDILAIFGGYVMTLEEEAKLPSDIGDFAHQIHNNFVLGIRNQEDLQEVDFFNHSCSPNAGFKGQIFLVAMKNIIDGEQVTFDYAMVLGENPKVKSYELKCECGDEKCRKIITDTDWKLPELQKRYDGYFQWFLQEKINKGKKV